MDINNLYDQTVHILKLPYKGNGGVGLIKAIKTSIQKTLWDSHDVRFILTGTKLSSHFNIKDDVNNQHKYDLVYFGRDMSSDCIDSFIGETSKRLSKRYR